MKQIKTFDNYIIEKYLYEEFNSSDIDFNSMLLNESVILDKLKNMDKGQIKKYLDKTYKLLISVKDKVKRVSIIKLLLIIYFSTLSVNNILDIKEKIKSSQPEIEEIASDINITSNKSLLFKRFKELIYDDIVDDEKEYVTNINDEIFKHAIKYSISDEAVDSIKQHEKLKLVGYSIGDGKITIGYGHAEPVRKSTYKVGQKISEQKAIELFKKDLKVAEDGVKRMFTQWFDEGIEVKITQGMYDSMVSIAFNAGVTGLRSSAFIKEVKKGNFMKAADLIPKTRNSGKFGGLNARRKTEQNIYLSDLLKYGISDKT